MAHGTHGRHGRFREGEIERMGAGVDGHEEHKMSQKTEALDWRKFLGLFVFFVANRIGRMVSGRIFLRRTRRRRRWASRGR